MAGHLCAGNKSVLCWCFYFNVNSRFYGPVAEGSEKMIMILMSNAGLEHLKNAKRIGMGFLFILFLRSGSE